MSTAAPGPITGFSSTNSPYIADSTDTADITVALKSLYYGSGGTASNTTGIYGMLYWLQNAPTITSLTTTSNIAVNGGSVTSTASTMNIGQTATSATTINIGTALTATSTTKTINIGTGSATGSTTNINIGPASTSLNSNIYLNGKPTLYALSNLSTPISGTIEYDGTVFYGTPKVNNTTYGRGIIPTTSIYSGTIGTVSTTTSSGTATNDYSILGKSIYLAASTTYFVELYVAMTHAITVSSGTGTITMYLKGPANTGYQVNGTNSLSASSFTGMTPTVDYYNGIGAATKQIITSSSSVSTKYDVLQWSGFISVGSTAGLFTPTLTLYAASGGGVSTTTATVQSGTYCKITPLGSTVNVGGWA